MSNHTICLDRVTNGYIVRVGCMSFVFNSFDEMLTELKAYHDNPKETERKWLGKAEEQNVSFMGSTVDAEVPPRYRGDDVSQVGATPVMGGGAAQGLVGGNR